MVREPTADGWLPVLAFPNLRHAFALFSDEVDASLGFRLTYGLFCEGSYLTPMTTRRIWSSYLSP
jgi:hypothetical protein